MKIQSVQRLGIDTPLMINQRPRASAQPSIAPLDPPGGHPANFPAGLVPTPYSRFQSALVLFKKIGKLKIFRTGARG